VVDRNREIANLIEIYLRKEGYDVIKAHSPDEAMRLAVDRKPSVITLDVMLEGVDGFDFLQQLKEHPETSQIPVVILSIVCDEGKSCRLGAANYLEKPIDQERLVGIIDDLVGTIDTPLVLVVDDDRHIVDLLSRNLKNRGFAVASAYNGLEAMAAIQRKAPDLILLDLRMPEMDGYQVIEQVKKSDVTKHIPIVVMTAYHFDREKTDILNLAAEQVAKPFKPAQLAEKVATILEHEREQE
jgi:DNA-binding response OmpR family regulator